VKHAYFLTSEAAAIVYRGIDAIRVFVIAQMANAQCTTKDINENTISIIRRLSKSPRNPKPQNKFDFPKNYNLKNIFWYFLL